MKVITIASDLDNFFLRNLLMHSCEFFGLDLVVLLYTGGQWETHRNKDRLLLKYLEHEDKNELIFFTDAYDTVFLNGASVIQEAFEKANTPLLFSGEVNCWPFQGFTAYYPTQSQPVPYPYLNSGGYIGRAGVITELLQKYEHVSITDLKTLCDHQALQGISEQQYAWSNQYYWTLVYLSQAEVISIDTHASLFLTLGPSYDVLKEHLKDFATRGVQSSIYLSERSRLEDVLNFKEAMPSHIHFNGPFAKQIVKDKFVEGSLFPLLYRKGSLPEGGRRIDIIRY